MKRISSLFSAAALLTLSIGAQANVVGNVGGSSDDFLTLSSLGLNDGTVATLSGGVVYTSDEPFADIPKGGLYGGTFLASGPTAGSASTLTFTGDGVSFVSFLWGSPDSYNRVTVNGSGGYSHVFTTAELGLPGDGNQAVSDYVNFAGVDGTLITSLSFDNMPSIDAFETANFSVTPVPEPGTYALLLAGLGATGLFAARRKRS